MLREVVERSLNSLRLKGEGGEGRPRGEEVEEVLEGAAFVALDGIAKDVENDEGFAVGNVIEFFNLGDQVEFYV